jgi:PEP-CTERM motif-containing protein
MRNNSYVIAAAICAATQSIPATAALAPIGSDDFNDNSRLTANWGNTTLAGAGQLLEDNHRLEYFTVGAPTSGDFAAWDWNRYGGVNNQSWTFQMDISLPDLALSSGQRVFIGMQVPKPGLKPGENNNFFLYGDEETQSGRLFVAQSPSLNDSAPIASDVTVTALRLSFDGATGTMTAQYDPNGPVGGYQWTTLGSDASFGFPGTVTVFAGSANVSIAPTDLVFADNVVAVPEASTYALMLVGLSLVGSALYRRNRLPAS